MLQAKWLLQAKGGCNKGVVTLYKPHYKHRVTSTGLQGACYKPHYNPCTTMPEIGRRSGAGATRRAAHSQQSKRALLPRPLLHRPLLHRPLLPRSLRQLAIPLPAPFLRLGSAPCSGAVVTVAVGARMDGDRRQWGGVTAVEMTAEGAVAAALDGGKKG